MRPRVGSFLASVLYMSLGFSWFALTREPWWLAPAWFVVVGVGGAFIPGEANQVSLARAYLAAPVFLYAQSEQLGAVAVTVAVAGVTDLVDGTVARRFSHQSNLGGALDPVVDGIFMAALVFGLAGGAILPPWLALVVVGRYALPAVGGGVLILAGRRPELRHTLTGQVSTVLILVLVGGVALIRGLGQDASGWLAGAEVVIPIATVATFVHLGFAAFRRPAVAAEPG